jgi:hypothetical protein
MLSTQAAKIKDAAKVGHQPSFTIRSEKMGVSLSPHPLINFMSAPAYLTSTNCC